MTNEDINQLDNSDGAIYENILQCHRESLANTSYDKSGHVYVTTSQADVVDFDAFKSRNYLSSTLDRKENGLKSCDAFYIKRTGICEWFLIEFKNGVLDGNELHKVHQKKLDSLLLLSLRFDHSIQYMRENLYIILVYNADKNSRKEINRSMRLLRPDYHCVFLPKYLDIFCKRVIECSIEQFEELRHQFGL